MLPAEQLRPAIARRRAQWKKYQGRLDPARLVFIDETWVKTNMAPLRGWAPVGQRLHAKVPYGHWRTMTFLAALRCDRIDAPCVLDQPVNEQSFTDYIERCVVPTLSPGDVVIMDNLSSHKKPAIRDAIRAVGARLLFLPPYSPDLNPIEQVFAKALLSLSKGSSTSCARPPSDPMRQHGDASARFSMPSPPQNAATTSSTQDMGQLDVIRL